MEDLNERKKKKIYNFILYTLAFVGVVSIALQLSGKRISSVGTLTPFFDTKIKNSVIKAGVASKAFIYSFYADDDRDGLSNAKELIYGSDPNNRDTDGDNINDNDEVKRGNDPLRAGTVPLKERLIKNYTIDYFVWASSVKKIPDPTIDSALVDEFISNLDPKNFELIEIDDSVIRQNNNISLKSYFDQINQIKFPEAISTYKDIADGFLRGEVNFDELSRLVNSLELSLVDIKRIETPKELAAYHKKIIKLFTNFLVLVRDLSGIYTDPVKIYLNNRKGLKLYVMAQELVEFQKTLTGSK